MKPNILKEALDKMRSTTASPDQVQEASKRVLQNLEARYSTVTPFPSADSRIEGCEDFRALIPAYLSSTLSDARKLLLQDHLRECVRCRKALDALHRGGAAETAVRTVRTGASQGRRRTVYRLAWGVAAVALLAVALQTNTVRDIVWPIDVHATALNVDGGLYSVGGQQAHSMNAGQRIDRNQPVRTGNNSGAVLELADGSRIEMSARAELSLDRASDGMKIQLERGNIIVTAAKQGSGHLYVETKDCTVSVVGTVFSVSAAAKGSRVSVIEGQVRVDQGNSTVALTPGQQTVTNTAMERVAVSDDIAWSRDFELHLNLLKEVSAFSNDFSKRIETAEMRHTSTLIPLVPENTLILASLPNASRSFADAYATFRQRIDENAQLKDWWSKNASGAAGHPSMDEIANRVSRVGAYLGPEIVIAIPVDPDVDPPVFLANVTSAAGLTAALQTIPTNMVVSIDDQLLVISSDAKQVQRILGFRRQPSLNPFAKTALYAKLAQAYTEGVGWLFAADLQRLVGASGTAQASQTGFEDVQQLLIEQKTGSAGGAYRAVLGFNATRQGMAAWLAEPAPMGVLEFVSPNAYGVAAVLTKDPTLIFDDVFKMIRADPEALSNFQKFQNENRLDIRSDLAAAPVSYTHLTLPTILRV